ncbi:hypothetical protein SAM23877_5738 [Streptomyces ambofaciens ATCC 23877]|uniref:Uncharacterized protein n=1 Tax=Streptomyces ambofaciens (strain ATCC 23877 / 3486 / DSM 40053 / JCM 4204 / NBRC 12836 / NRRL B-2516) TaxID=278992 RepID=A0A0K2B0P0_STRA7|nr:hypothetical protein SAM23877_5738 [Streptomyces ambofaciens ATCC 23877]
MASIAVTRYGFRLVKSLCVSAYSARIYMTA